MKDKFTVKVSDKGTLREYAQIALDSKMYIDDGEHLLEGEYRGIIASVGYKAYTYVREGKMRARPECIVGLCYHGDELVGWVWVEHYNERQEKMPTSRRFFTGIRQMVADKLGVPLNDDFHEVFAWVASA